LHKHIRKEIVCPKKPKAEERTVKMPAIVTERKGMDLMSMLMYLLRWVFYIACSCFIGIFGYGINVFKFNHCANRRLPEASPCAARPNDKAQLPPG